MTATIQHTLKTVFGFHEFRSPQQEVIERVVAGEDVFLVMPTGGGKSLCYQIPALHRDGVAIVVSPLISLMKDQVDALVANGVRAACFNSSLSVAGEDVFLVMPTGGGKSLCYQIPALHRAGVAIVVSPLISLMKDQVDALVGQWRACGLFQFIPLIG